MEVSPEDRFRCMEVFPEDMFHCLEASLKTGFTL